MTRREMEDAIKQRVAQVMKDCKISVNRLATASGISQRTLNDQINGNSKITAATLVALAESRQDISSEWLLRGVGEMYLSGDNATNAENEIVTTRQKEETPTAHLRDTNDRESLYLERIDMLKQKVQDKEEVIATQKETIANLNNPIADLRHTLHFEEQCNK